MREILTAAVKPASRVRVGEALAAIGRRIGLTQEDVATIERARDTVPVKPLRFD